jgi:parvulin-like peptidyl-prolyl isomerase
LQHPLLEIDAGSRQARRPQTLLALGAIAGLALATAGILEPAPSTRARSEDAVAGVNAVAEVNGTIIRKATYERALAALTRDRRDPLGEVDRRYVLDRLIEEELLLQRAVDLGLDKSNPVVRNTLVSAMIETIVSGVGPREPDAEQVAAFYAQNRGFFARGDRFWLRQLRFPIEAGGDRSESERAALGRAQQAARRARTGESLDEIARELGSISVAPLPDGLLPAVKLREYLGPGLAGEATGLKPGEVSDPIRGSGAYHVFRMLERVENPAPELADVESQVRAEMRRRAGDESLRAYLDQLRTDATIRLPDS